MTTRRGFLLGLLGAGVWVQVRPRASAAAPARTVRLAFALTTGSSFSKGAALAFAEARQTAGLLGSRFELANPGADVFATIGELDPVREPRGLFFAVSPTASAPVRPRVFHVAASPRLRQRALSRHRGPGLRVVDWLPSLSRFGASELNQRYRRRFGTLMDEAAWHGWIAVKIAAELALRGAGRDPAAALLNAGFDGHKGSLLRFDRGDHHLLQPVYVVDATGRLVDEVEVEA